MNANRLPGLLQALDVDVIGVPVVRGLVAVRASTTTYTLTSADIIEFYNPTNNAIEYIKESQGSLTLDSAVAGPAANGRDQSGAFSSSQWLHVYYIRSGDTIASILSDAAPPTGPELPSGYTSWAYAFPIRWDGSSNFVDSYARGNVVGYASSISELSGGSQTTFTSVDLATSVPPQAVCPFWWGYFGNNNNADTAITIDLSINGTNSIGQLALDGASGNLRIFGLTGPIPNIAQTVYYKVSDGLGGTLHVSGYAVANGG